MTKEQQKSSLWFAAITIILTLASILTTQRISTANLSQITRAVAQLNDALGAEIDMGLVTFSTR